MDITKASIDDEILLEFHFDRYGYKILNEKEFQKKLLSNILQFSQELTQKKSEKAEWVLYSSININEDLFT